MTTSSRVTTHDGRMFKVRTNDGLARVSPVIMRQVDPPDGDGGMYESDGPLLAWFRLVPGIGWHHKETGQSDRDSVRLALRIIKAAD